MSDVLGQQYDNFVSMGYTGQRRAEQFLRISMVIGLDQVPFEDNMAVSRTRQPVKDLAGVINLADCRCANFWRMRTPARSSLHTLKHIADEIVGALREGSEGASERELLLVFEEHGYDPETFYGIVAELEQRGLVRWHGNLLFPALLN